MSDQAALSANSHTYSIPSAITTALQRCCANIDNMAGESSCDRVLPSVADALQQIISNSMQSLDEFFFNTPSSKKKNKAEMNRRLCVRINFDEEKGILSITDYGIGMTRADLINCLGVGGGAGGGVGAGGDAMDHHEPEENFSDSDSSDDSDGIYAKKARERARHTNGKANGNGNVNESGNSSPSDVIDATPAGVGGFYSAVCAIGECVEVGTKSKFDDYYTFVVGGEVGFGDCSNADNDGNRNEKKDENKDNEEEKPFSTFTITKPLPEGTTPSPLTGFTSFSSVTGEAGTRVSMKLSPRALSSEIFSGGGGGLKEVVEKCFERSDYSFCFWDSEEAGKMAGVGDAAGGNFYEEGKNYEDFDEFQDAKMQDDDGGGGGVGGNEPDNDEDDDAMIGESDPGLLTHMSVSERSKFIPLRLTLAERKLYRLVEAAITCTDYTSTVDANFKNKGKRIHAILKGISSVFVGLVLACDYEKGMECAKTGDFREWERGIQDMFEIVRRHKIMNPEKMRSEYGKLLYLIQDAVSPDIRPDLGFNVKGELRTVYEFLKERAAEGMLDDKYIEVATREILPDRGKTRAQIQKEIRQKEKAVAYLKEKYSGYRLSEDDIHMCLYSICDNNSFLNSNRLPIDKVIGYLKQYFSPKNIVEGYSLAIVNGSEGSRLSHSHERQYYFALQSLTLWRDILDDMFRLWKLAEDDILSEAVTYKLKDTGQGVQRVQQSPRSYKAMTGILRRVQNSVDTWIGSSVIHMGDHNVPNALTFIDKYTQVPRILGPIVNCLENLEKMEDAAVVRLLNESYGGLDGIKREILHDFFTSAFDGSGADTYYDAGSCIDGRLTSAWNWCQALETKSYYPIFKLTGFTGFDGEFK